MFIVMGGTGHIGSQVARALLADREEVTVITHGDAKLIEAEGCVARMVVADVLDADALRKVFRQGKRLFLLNPPAPPSGDTDAEENRSIASILRAVDGADLEWIVAESTYGAQPGDRLGDLSTLYTMEAGLHEQSTPFVVLRAAYYMSNWDAALQSARDKGIVNTVFPNDFALPMVAPRDVGPVAARLLKEPKESGALHYIEGPGSYSAADVARAFEEALKRPVQAKDAPREKWVSAYQEQGFSKAAAESYARMTGVVLDGDYDKPMSPERGSTTLRAYIEALVGKSSK